MIILVQIFAGSLENPRIESVLSGQHLLQEIHWISLPDKSSRFCWETLKEEEPITTLRSPPYSETAWIIRADVVALSPDIKPTLDSATSPYFSTSESKQNKVNPSSSWHPFTSLRTALTSPLSHLFSNLNVFSSLKFIWHRLKVPLAGSCLPLDIPLFINTLLKLGCPELNMVFQCVPLIHTDCGNLDESLKLSEPKATLYVYKL